MSSVSDQDPIIVYLEPNNTEQPKVVTKLYETKICKIVYQGMELTLRTPKILDDPVTGSELIIYPAYREFDNEDRPSLIIYKFDARVEFKLGPGFEMIPVVHNGVPFRDGEEVIYVCPGY